MWKQLPTDVLVARLMTLTLNDDPVPVDLEVELHERGIYVSDETVGTWNEAKEDFEITRTRHVEFLMETY